MTIQLKAYLEMKAQSLEEAAKTFTSNYDKALSIAKANGFREALQVIESSSYKWYKRCDIRKARKTEWRMILNIIAGLLFLCVSVFLAIGALSFTPTQKIWLSILIGAVLSLLLMWHNHLSDLEEGT